MEYKQKKKTNVEVPQLVILECSPMVSLSNDDNNLTLSGIDGDEDDKEANQFTAEVHANFIEKSFEYFGNIGCKEWAKAQIADNAAVNKRAAQLLGIVYIPCKKHLLSSEV